MPATRAVSFLRPLARRRFNTLRPFTVFMRARKPWRRRRLVLLGWYVLFISLQLHCGLPLDRIVSIGRNSINEGPFHCQGFGRVLVQCLRRRNASWGLCGLRCTSIHHSGLRFGSRLIECSSKSLCLLISRLGFSLWSSWEPKRPTRPASTFTFGRPINFTMTG